MENDVMFKGEVSARFAPTSRGFRATFDAGGSLIHLNFASLDHAMMFASQLLAAAGKRWPDEMLKYDPDFNPDLVDTQK